MGESKKKGTHSLGVFLLFVVVLLWVTSSLFTQAINKPFFVSYLNASLQIIFLLPYLFKNRSQTQYKKLFFLALMFCPVWLTMSSSFNWSLSATSMTSNSIISTSSNLFVMMWSSVLLSEPFRPLSFLGAALTIAGSVVVTLSAGASVTDSERSMLGDGAALLSAFVGGFYTAMLKKKMPNDDDSNDMSLFFGFLGLISFIAGSPVVFFLHHLGIEPLNDVFSHTNVALLITNTLLTVISNYIWAKAIVLTSPLVATVGLSLMTPLCMLVDIAFHGKTFAPIYYGGASLVVVGYLVTNWQHSTDESVKKEKKSQ